ncbi:MAG TPA: hypothetical protein DCO73_05810, partial [Alphaproteobacteria bacterium]|nr:hypothetical protein [Alphaproteobacteria bacterium]
CCFYALLQRVMPAGIGRAQGAAVPARALLFKSAVPWHDRGDDESCRADRAGHAGLRRLWRVTGRTGQGWRGSATI